MTIAIAEGIQEPKSSLMISKKDNSVVASFQYMSTNYCCGERRIGSLTYNMEYYDSKESCYKMLTTDEVKVHCKELLRYYNDSLIPMMRANLNGAYRLWDEVLLEEGFVLVYEWRNKSDGNWMKEYMRAAIPGEKFRQVKK